MEASPGVIKRAPPDGTTCPSGYEAKGAIDPSGERFYVDLERSLYEQITPVECFTTGGGARTRASFGNCELPTSPACTECRGHSEVLLTYRRR